MTMTPAIIRAGLVPAPDWPPEAVTALRRLTAAEAAVRAAASAAKEAADGGDPRRARETVLAACGEVAAAREAAVAIEGVGWRPWGRPLRAAILLAEAACPRRWSEARLGAEGLALSEGLAVDAAFAATALRQAAELLDITAADEAAMEREQARASERARAQEQDASARERARREDREWAERQREARRASVREATAPMAPPQGGLEWFAGDDE